MYMNILVPLDGSLFAEHALPLAASIAKRSGGILTLARVHHREEAGLPHMGVWEEEIRRHERDYLARAAARLEHTTSIRVNTALLDEPIVAALCDYAGERAADLIVMTTHGRTGVSRAWLGSVADGIVQHATVPVLLRRIAATSGNDSPAAAFAVHHGGGLPKRLLVPLDGSVLAERVIPHVMALARATGAEVVFFRAVRPMLVRGLEYAAAYQAAWPVSDVDTERTARRASQARSYLARIVSRAHSSGEQIRLSSEVRVADAAVEGILEAARELSADAVAMASHGRGASRLLVGSVVDQVLRAGPASVLLLPSRAD